MQGRVRRKTLESLEGGPRTPSSIAESSDEHLSHISRALKELTERGLVECMTPGRSKNRVYRITDAGKEVMDELRKMG